MPSGTRDKIKISGTVPEIPGQLEPMQVVMHWYNKDSKHNFDALSY